MTDNEPTDQQKSSGAIFVFLLVSLPLLLFVPLLLSIVEHHAMGSNHVEEFCRTIGIHDFLSMIYRPLGDLIMKLM